GQVVDAVEGIEVRDTTRIRNRHEPVELPVVPRRECDPLLVRETPHDVGRDGAAEMRVELREPAVEQLGDRTQSGPPIPGNSAGSPRDVCGTSGSPDAFHASTPPTTSHTSR